MKKNITKTTQGLIELRSYLLKIKSGSDNQDITQLIPEA